MSTTPILEVTNLRVEYHGDNRQVVAVNDVSFSIGEGEIFGLAGESGCGKSTVANAIMRLLKDPAEITGGQIRFKGRDLLALRGEELRRFRWKEIAMIFQSAMNSLNPVMTIGSQMVDIFTTHEGLSVKQARSRSAELLRLVSIDPVRLDSYPHQLSGGMRQRAVIAMALALEPSLLIMDEPTTALDVVVQQEIMAQISDLQRQLGFSVLFITHDMSLMVELSHRMAVMHSGRLVEMADAELMFANPLHPYTVSLMNAFPPLTGPRVRLTGLSDAVRAADGSSGSCSFHVSCPPDRANCSGNIPDLREVEPERFVAEHPRTSIEGTAA